MSCDPRAPRGVAAVIGLALILAAGGCVSQGTAVEQTASARVVHLHIVPPPSVMFGAHPAPPTPVSPFADAPVSFLIRGHFARGELVIVRVCLRADHSIASSEVVESSGDRRFDEMAANWAQRVRLREQPPDGRPVAACGAVRVELHDTAEPAVIDGHDDLLG